jgi:hypothetical protein
MRKIVKIGLFAIFLSLLYSICWYIATINLCSEINKQVQTNITTEILGSSVTFTFKKATPYGFPFKIGCRIIGLNEDTDNYAISHNGIIVFGYDILNKGLFFSNNGESFAKIKPQVSGFGAKVTSNNSYFFKLPISKKLLSVINKNATGIELVNFIKSIEINAKNVQAHDLIDNSLIFDHELTKAKLSWERNYYYRDLEDVNNHIPPKYNLNLDMIIKNVVNNKKIIAPFSLVYFLLPNNKFEVNIVAELNTKAQKADFLDVFQNSSINFQKFTYNGLTAKSDFKGLMAIETSGGRESAVFDFVLVANFNSLELAKIYSEKFYPYFVTNKVTKFQEQQHKDWLAKLQNNQYELNIAADGNYVFSRKLKNLNLESLKITLNDTGFNFHGQSSFSSPIDWYADGNLILFNYPQIVTSAMGIISKYQQPSNHTISPKLEDDIKYLLRQISNHPESNNNDLAIDFQLSHNLSNSKIGNLPLGLFLENYSKILNHKN